MSGPMSPGSLHLILGPAPSVDLRFPSERRLSSYRANLYAINGQGRYRYRTRRMGLTLRVIRDD